MEMKPAGMARDVIGERKGDTKWGFCGQLYLWDGAADKDVIREMMVLRTEGGMMLVLTRLVAMMMLS